MNYLNLKVLIVDDSKTTRTAFEKVLKSLGFDHFEHADNIAAAWKVIEADKVEIVFCDWNMPGGDGIELLKKMRASSRDKIKFKRFIMVTGAQLKALTAMDCGANNLVHKPFDIDDIKTKLDLVFHTH
jgi:two-component system, chemotaxis family, chemotaxis protein CheY